MVIDVDRTGVMLCVRANTSMAKRAKQQWDGICERKDRPGFEVAGRMRRAAAARRNSMSTRCSRPQAALAAEKHKVEEAIRFGKPLPTEDSFTQFAKEFLKRQSAASRPWS